MQALLFPWPESDTDDPTHDERIGDLEEGIAVMYRFLFVTRFAEAQWTRALRETMANAASVEIVDERSLDFLSPQYDLMIVDAGGVSSFPRVVRRLRAMCARCPILVVTASPTWQRAREAMHAGANDYQRKTLDNRELWQQITAVFPLPLLPPSVESQEESVDE